jgi:hypothetical protein
MATNYTDLKGEIKAQIKPNGVGAITGQVLQDAMLNLVHPRLPQAAYPFCGESAHPLHSLLP